MRPLGFETPLKRFKRSLLVSLLTGVAVSIITAFAGSLKSFPAGHPTGEVATVAFALSFLASFGLAITRAEYAPPQPRDDGDAEAGVTARLVPPSPILTAMEAQKMPNQPAQTRPTSRPV